MTDTDEYAEISARQLCATCIGETFLRGEVEQLGRADRCDYCDNTAPACSIGEMADYIDTAFEQHYRRTPFAPSSIEDAMMGDWFRDGDPSVYAIAAAAEINEAPADDIRRVLEERHYDHEMAKMGEENPFEWDAC